LEFAIVAEAFTPERVELDWIVAMNVEARSVGVCIVLSPARGEEVAMVT
jgi:hypothetical protein